jgi:hypothetical protein
MSTPPDDGYHERCLDRISELEAEQVEHDKAMASAVLVKNILTQQRDQARREYQVACGRLRGERDAALAEVSRLSLQLGEAQREVQVLTEQRDYYKGMENSKFEAMLRQAKDALAQLGEARGLVARARWFDGKSRIDEQWHRDVCKLFPDLERWRSFNESTGALTWNYRSATQHPDRCVCQDETTPHKHYTDDPKHPCARCGCTEYRPALPGPGAQRAFAPEEKKP